MKLEKNSKLLNISYIIFVPDLLSRIIRIIVFLFNKDVGLRYNSISQVDFSQFLERFFRQLEF